MGPVECPIEKINNAFRMHIIIKNDKKDWLKLYERWCSWLEQVETEQFSLSFNGPTSYRVWNFPKRNNSSVKGLSIALGKYYRNKLEIN